MSKRRLDVVINFDNSRNMESLSKPLETRRAADAFAAMGAQARLAVLQLLVRAGDSGLVVSEIQAQLEIPGSTLSHHLKFLAAAELITQTKTGRTIVVQANYDHLRDLADFILASCCIDEKEAVA